MSYGLFLFSLLRTRHLENVIGTTLGQWVLVGCVFLFLQCAGTVVWIAFGGNEEFSTSWNDSWWISYTLLVDIGTQTGLSARERGSIKFVSAVISLVGFVYFLTLLGMVVDLLRDFLNDMRMRFSSVRASNHWLILGWGDKTLLLIDELLTSIASAPPQRKCCGCCGCRRRRQIVILADMPTQQMADEVQVHCLADPLLQRITTLFLPVVCYKQGNPTDISELLSVSAPNARDILVARTSENGHLSDLKAISALLALAAMPVDSPVNGDVWVEVCQEQSLRTVKTILPDSHGIVARKVVNRMMVLRALVPSVGFVFLSMTSASFANKSQTQLSAKSQLLTPTVGRPQGPGPRAPATVPAAKLHLVPAPPSVCGVPFSEVGRFFPDAVVCGVKCSVESRKSIIPEGNYCMQAQDVLVMVAPHAAAAKRCVVPRPSTTSAAAVAPEESRGLYLAESRRGRSERDSGRNTYYKDRQDRDVPKPSGSQLEQITEEQSALIEALAISPEKNDDDSGHIIEDTELKESPAARGKEAQAKGNDVTKGHSKEEAAYHEGYRVFCENLHAWVDLNDYVRYMTNGPKCAKYFTTQAKTPAGTVVLQSATEVDSEVSAARTFHAIEGYNHERYLEVVDHVYRHLLKYPDCPKVKGIKKEDILETIARGAAAGLVKSHVAHFLQKKYELVKCFVRDPLSDGNLLRGDQKNAYGKNLLRWLQVNAQDVREKVSPLSEVESFFKTDDLNGILSNYSGGALNIPVGGVFAQQITVSHRELSNPEAAFHGAKAFRFGDMNTLTKLVNTKRPQDARALSREVVGVNYKEWECASFWASFDASLYRMVNERDFALHMIGKNVFTETNPDDYHASSGMSTGDIMLAFPSFYPGRNSLGGSMSLAAAFVFSAGVDNLENVDSFLSAYDPESMCILSLGIHSATAHPYLMKGYRVLLDKVEPNRFPVDYVRLKVVKTIFEQETGPAGGDLKVSGAGREESRTSSPALPSPKKADEFTAEAASAAASSVFLGAQAVKSAAASEAASDSTMTSWEVVSEAAIEKHNIATADTLASGFTPDSSAPAVTEVAETTADDVTFVRASIRRGKLCIRGNEGVFGDYVRNVAVAPGIRSILLDTASFILADFFTAS
eukprot:s1799_g5.t1